MVSLFAKGEVVSEERPFSHLAVAGSSAGGIGALSEPVSGLPEDFPVSIVAVQYLNPGWERILERRRPLPFRMLQEQTTLPLDPGVVFVALSDRHVNTIDHEIHLQKASVGLRAVRMDRSGWEIR